ncbi:MAG: 2-polyprenylphenol 6-hydroxylase [Deltaproteobacteria bacterium]|nr:2-polyprenylphenol 6-hydroxylase [Deltaproteobacteria bacterium]
MKSIRFYLAYKGIRRLRVITSVLVKYGFQPLLSGLHMTGLITFFQRISRTNAVREEKSAPLRARLAMEELGPAFIKLGQILSTRPDVLPEGFIVEFLKLQDTVAPVPFRDAVRVIEEEFGRPYGEIFSNIEETPVAAASIAQVHRATTISGEDVVVKIQRPHIEETIETDISIVDYLARLMYRYVPESRIYDPPGVVDEFSRVIKKELDFTLEASYTEKFREYFKDDPRVLIPKVYREWSGKRVLTMERVGGIKVDNVGKMKEEGIDTGKVAHLMADIFFKQVFDFGLFHGDLHSGNIFVVDEGRVALVDFGIVGRIDRQMKQHLADILIGFVTGDLEALTKVYLRMGILPKGIDRASFESEYYDVMFNDFGKPFKQVSMGDLMMDYVRLASRHNIRFPKGLLLFDKCIIELEGLARILYPEANILTESEQYASRLLRERVSPLAFAGEAAEAMSDYRGFMKDAPIYGGRIMEKLADNRFRVEFLHRGLEGFIGVIDRSSGRLAFGMIMASLVIGSSLVITSDAGPYLMGYPALGIIGFIIASLLGLWAAVRPSGPAGH